MSQAVMAAENSGLGICDWPSPVGQPISWRVQHEALREQQEIYPQAPRVLAFQLRCHHTGVCVVEVIPRPHKHLSRSIRGAKGHPVVTPRGDITLERVDTW